MSKSKTAPAPAPAPIVTIDLCKTIGTKIAAASDDPDAIAELLTGADFAAILARAEADAGGPDALSRRLAASVPPRDLSGIGLYAYRTVARAMRPAARAMHGKALGIARKFGATRFATDAAFASDCQAIAETIAEARAASKTARTEARIARARIATL